MGAREVVTAGLILIAALETLPGAALAQCLDADGDRFTVGPGCAPADCDDTDPTSYQLPVEVTGLRLDDTVPRTIAFAGQSQAAGPSTTYSVMHGPLSRLALTGSFGGAACVSAAFVSDGPEVSVPDLSPDPDRGDGTWLLARADNGCGRGTYGDGLLVPDPRDGLDALPSCANLMTTCTSAAECNARLDSPAEVVVQYNDIACQDSCLLFARDGTILDGNGRRLTGIGIGPGIDLAGRTAVTIRNADISGFQFGVFDGVGSSEARVEASTIHHNALDGVFLRSGGNYAITGNTLYRNGGLGLGMVFTDSSTIAGNHVWFNYNGGIFLSWSSSITLTCNRVEGNGDQPGEFGVNLRNGTTGIRVLGNDLVFNIAQAHDSGAGNAWDGGPAPGGNHWSDFDEDSEGCFDTDPVDGRCDSPYVNEAVLDRYPLMRPPSCLP